MLTKSKIRRLNPQQILQLVAVQTIPENLTLCQQDLANRNESLLSKRQALLEQLISRRVSIKDTVLELKDSMKEKLRLKEKVVMEKDSRPSAAQIKQLSKTYNVTEKQRLINEKKDKHIESLSKALSECLASLETKIQQQSDNSQLDKRFQELNAQCAKQTEVRDQLIAERDRYRKFYEGIEEEIGECRRSYEDVESSIRSAQRELIQLSSYLENRSKQDAEALDDLRKIADDLESELLKGQELMNFNSEKKRRLRIGFIEAVGPAYL